MNGNAGIAAFFLEGLLSFFSPCVLPLVPLYISYLTAGSEQETDGKRRARTAVRTVCFVLGICTVFFIAGLSSELLRTFFSGNQLLFQLFGGMVLILMGLFSAGFIRIPLLETEYRPFRKLFQAGSLVRYYLLGFFFSFAWSPCIGPLLASAITAAAAAETSAQGWFFILAYSLGFICVFLVCGLFADEVLSFIRKSRKLTKPAKILSSCIVLAMGIYMCGKGAAEVKALQSGEGVSLAQEAETDLEKYDAALVNENGETVYLHEYQGTPLVINFFATWCYYCKQELPHLQEISDQNQNVKVLLIAAPGLGSEGDMESVLAFLEENHYSFEVLFDTTYQMTRLYHVNGYPMTYLVKRDGNFYGYIPGYVDEETMDEILAGIESE